MLIGGVAKEVKQKEGTTTKKSNTLQGQFPQTVYWEALKHIEMVVDEPIHATFKNQTTHAPGIPDEQALYILIKHNFDEKWSCSELEGMFVEYKKTHRGAVKCGKDGKEVNEGACA